MEKTKFYTIWNDEKDAILRKLYPTPNGDIRQGDRLLRLHREPPSQEVRSDKIARL